MPKTKSHNRKRDSLRESLIRLRLHIMATVPGLLDTDQAFRHLIVGHLLENYRKEVLSEIQAGVKKAAHA